MMSIRESFRNVLLLGEKSCGGEVSHLGLNPNAGDAVVNELRWFERPTAEECELLEMSLGDDGLWPDIDYDDLDPSSWDAAKHLRRLVSLALHPCGVASVSACHRGLKGWLKIPRVNLNWWWNEVGCPKELGVFSLLFDDELTEEERRGVLERMPVGNPSRTGQNRVWDVECQLLRGIIADDKKAIADAKDALVSEVTVRDGVEGLQSDWSFHQHGKMPQFGNYGIAYLLTLSRWAAVFAGAEDGFPAEQLQLLGDFLTRGMQCFVWRGRMDVGALGRQFGDGMLRLKGLAVELSEYYLVRAGWRSSGAMSSAGVSFFGRSAMAAYRTDRWMATVKAETKSISGVEMVNGDNLLGAHLADGALFCIVYGDEYENVFPVWNWCHIPGITGYDTAEVVWMDDNGKTRVRNQAETFERSSDDSVRFVLRRDGLMAETEWRFSKDGVDVSVRHIAAASDGIVVTTIEQACAKPNARWWREGDQIVAVNGGIRYEVPGNAVVLIEPRVGNWRRVASSLPSETVSSRIFEITVPHGKRPQDGSCFWKVRFPIVDEKWHRHQVRRNSIVAAEVNEDFERIRKIRDFALGMVKALRGQQDKLKGRMSAKLKWLDDGKARERQAKEEAQAYCEKLKAVRDEAQRGRELERQAKEEAQAYCEKLKAVRDEAQRGRELERQAKEEAQAYCEKLKAVRDEAQRGRELERQAKEEAQAYCEKLKAVRDEAQRGRELERQAKEEAQAYCEKLKASKAYRMERALTEFCDKMRRLIAPEES